MNFVVRNSRSHTLPITIVEQVICTYLDYFQLFCHIDSKTQARVEPLLDKAGALVVDTRIYKSMWCRRKTNV